VVQKREREGRKGSREKKYVYGVVYIAYIEERTETEWK